MSEMVERVAQAMCAVERDQHSCPTDYRCSDCVYLPEARAAIEAMREPTEAMLSAARDWSMHKYGKPIGNDAAEGCLKAMIEAGLK
jgi:hypothetical protein